MKIFVTGTRGIPDIPGGVEKHCQELYPLVVMKGHEVTVATRRSYARHGEKVWRGVRLVHLYAPGIKSLEAIVHTFLSVLEAWISHIDVLHIHAVGPGLMVPLARLLGMKVVVTNHGPDYNREKWGRLAKCILKVGEWAGGKFANEVIAISAIIRDIVRRRCGRDATIIYNGVSIPEKSEEVDFLERIGVAPGKFLLAVSRVVPEKGLHILMEAFKQIETDYRLVMAGDADYETEYSLKLKRAIKGDKRIIRTGYVTGDELNQLFSHAGLFVLPSFHEGLPIALLEAMGYGLPVLASDIPANRELHLPAESYFKCGDVRDLKGAIERILEEGFFVEGSEDLRSMFEEKYNWRKIAEQTINVYERALK